MASWFRRSSVDTTKLPPGDLGSSFVGNTFQFHQDAQSLILANLARHPGTPIIRAKVIGRDVALVIDHSVAVSLLDQRTTGSPEEAKRPRFSHREAYKQLIATFFTEPNILLEDEDEPNRPQHRAAWNEHMQNVLDEGWSEIDTGLRRTVEGYKSKWTAGDALDLYDTCKDLSHELLFGLFLGLDREVEPELYKQTLSSSGTSSRGQFAVPLRANLGGMFESTYSRGLRAQAEFNDIVSSRTSAGKCPFLKASFSDSVSKESADSHTSMFSSSLVIKALSSYLTFALLQFARHPSANPDHLLQESGRLSPPIIGVLRRVLDNPWNATPAMQIPVGWDAWLYFPLINRDPNVYGSDSNLFRAERWEDSGLPDPMTFGKGAKRCLGRKMVFRIARLVLEVLREDNISVNVLGEVDKSVQDFLGWIDDDKQRREGWKGVKQLPVQRPRAPITVRFETRK